MCYIKIIGLPVAEIAESACGLNPGNSTLSDQNVRLYTVCNLKRNKTGFLFFYECKTKGNITNLQHYTGLVEKDME